MQAPETEYVVMMPGWTQEEVSSFLRPIYGLEEGLVTSNNPFCVDFNVTDRNSNISRPKISDPNPKVELVERSEETLETFPSHMVPSENYEEVKPAGKRKRGRPGKRKRKNNTHKPGAKSKARPHPWMRPGDVVLPRRYVQVRISPSCLVFRGLILGLS